jgi:uncharacterized membrane protein YfcA
MTSYAIIVGVLAFVAGATSAVAGFGIGSILTPLLALAIGAKLAVAAAAIPHLLGNSMRLWTLRHRIDKEVLKTFGLMSAAGALAGALLHAFSAPPALKVAMAVILIIAGILGIAGLIEHIRMKRHGAWVAGALSGFLGGLVGNQGGVRAAAMLALDVRKEVFVATAVAIALVVDGARMPVYAFSVGRQLLSVWPIVATACGGVLLGTLTGKKLLGWIPEETFRKIVSGLLIALGAAILISGK